MDLQTYFARFACRRPAHVLLAEVGYAMSTVVPNKVNGQCFVLIDFKLK